MMNSKMSRSAPELELQRAVHCFKYAEPSTLQLKNVYSFVLKLNDGLKSAIMGLRSTIRSLRKVEQERDYWKMRFEALKNRDDGNNWRIRYESLLERNEQLEEELRKLYSNEMAIEDFHSRMDVGSPFFAGSAANGASSASNGPTCLQRALTNSGRVNDEDNNEDDAEDDDESSFEDDSEDAAGVVRNFPLMLEGPPMNVLSDSSGGCAFNPATLMKIKCEVEESVDDNDNDNDEDLEMRIKDHEHTTGTSPAESNNNNIGSNNNNVIDVDYEALRNCLAKDARQCPVCPRICSQRNSTVRHLIEVHHLDRSELMIRKFHKGYHFANFSK